MKLMQAENLIFHSREFRMFGLRILILAIFESVPPASISGRSGNPMIVKFN